MDGLPPMAPLELEAYERLIRCGHTDEQTRRWMLAFRQESEAFAVRFRRPRGRRGVPPLAAAAEGVRRGVPPDGPGGGPRAVHGP